MVGQLVSERLVALFKVFSKGTFGKGCQTMVLGAPGVRTFGLGGQDVGLVIYEWDLFVLQSALIFHGDKDQVVPLGQSEHIHRRYQEEGLESSLHVIEGAGHGGPQFSDSIRYELVKEFLDGHIKQVEAQGPARHQGGVWKPNRR